MNRPPAAERPLDEPSAAWLTVAETAALLRLDSSHVYELLRRHELPHIRFGRAIRIPRHALFSHLERMAAESVAR